MRQYQYRTVCLYTQVLHILEKAEESLQLVTATAGIGEDSTQSSVKMVGTQVVCAYVVSAHICIRIRILKLLIFRLQACTYQCTVCECYKSRTKGILAVNKYPYNVQSLHQRCQNTLVESKDPLVHLCTVSTEIYGPNFNWATYIIDWHWHVP